MRWYCQVYRFQIMEKHIDSIKWKNALVLSNHYTTIAIVKLNHISNRLQQN